MIRVLTSLLIWCGLVTQANAGEFDQLVGTVGVTFAPIATEGRVDGCSLVFDTVALDYAYLQGNPVFGAGNFTVMGSNNQLGMSLKLGVANILAKPPKPEAPNYAYIKTKKGSTAGVKYIAVDSDKEGFKMFVYEANEKSLAVVYDLIEGVNPTIGFNRKKGGIDVMLPLDLTVANSKSAPDGSRQQFHSQVALDGFRQCIIELAERL